MSSPTAIRATGTCAAFHVLPMCSSRFDWYAERGWRVPSTAAIMANVLHGADHIVTLKSKPVWRLAFFGRLEERKGLVSRKHTRCLSCSHAAVSCSETCACNAPDWLPGMRNARQRWNNTLLVVPVQKLFVDAIDMLPSEITTSKRFEVLLVGAESMIDQQPSSIWLKARTAKWTWRHTILASVPRPQALAAIRQEGVLLALCSLVEVRAAQAGRASAFLSSCASPPL